MAARNEVGTTEGIIVEVLPGELYRVELREGRHIVANPSRTFRLRMTRLIPGVKVAVELSSYDQQRGRITNLAD